jgi:hydroxymethylpyrimidine pyrophosphatase-like HAD family hydrolase
MLANAALGVAMGNARVEVRAVAGQVIGPNGEEGLAQFLEELVKSRVRPMDVPEGTGRWHDP